MLLWLRQGKKQQPFSNCHIFTVYVVTSSLKLNPLTEGDMTDVHILNSHEKVARFNTIGIPSDLNATLEFHKPMIDNPDYIGWSIRLKDDNTFIGIMGLRLAPARFRSGEVHYSVIPKYWGRGFATEAVKAIVDLAFNTLNLHRIEAGCAVENCASIRVLEKTGFVKEGRKRKVLPLQNGWSDNYEYAILKEDLK